MRRRDRELDQTAAWAILEKGAYGVLSTVSPDGTPYGVPLSYCLLEGAIYLHSAREGRKLDHLAREPRVSFCVVGATEVLPADFGTLYESCVVEGVAREAIGDEMQAALEGLLAKYSPDHVDEGLRYIDALRGLGGARRAEGTGAGRAGRSSHRSAGAGGARVCHHPETRPWTPLAAGGRRQRPGRPGNVSLGVHVRESEAFGSTAAVGAFVPAGGDTEGALRGLGVSTIQFKVSGRRDVLVLENAFHAKGGPARHLHLEQDEWFYVLEGEFLVEVGDRSFHLLPGDAVLAQRQVPHVWAHVGETRGRILIVFTPAGAMEDFFRVVTAENAMPPLDPGLWSAHGMQLLGPPLPVG